MANVSEMKTSDKSAQVLMLGYLCVKGIEGLPEKVGILDRFGLSDYDIALICNAASGSIRNARLQYKKAKTK
jgi:L-asparaginase II